MNTPQAALAELLNFSEMGMWHRARISDKHESYTFAPAYSLGAFEVIQSLKCDLHAAAIVDVQKRGDEIHVYFA